MIGLSKLFAAAGAALALGACATLADAQTEPLDPADAKDALTINRKIQCSTVDGEPIVYWWHGRAYSRKQGERDVHLFDVEGMNVRSCSSISDPDRGEGYALVSREILLYKDKETGEVLSTWDNPWSGETVEVLHVANDPVNFEAYEIGRDGQPSTWSGEVMNDQWWLRSTFPLWYPNPLGGPFQAEVGGTYHATEMFNFFGRTDELFDPETTTVPVTVGWSRMSDWLPWMKMNGREGMFWVHTAGAKLESWDQMSETMKAEIRANYPEYVAPPPTGDPRDNMTSWKYYKGVAAGEIEPPQR
ncbi:MAG: DUF1838 family protein [Pseudomonadota bacterium]